MRIKAWVMVAIAVVVFFGGIALSSALGYWKTTSEKIPAVIQEGENAGQADPMDIRGSYTFQNISDNFGIPIEDLARAFGVTTNPAVFKCKDLEGLYGDLTDVEIGTESVRYFVALYNGIPVQDSDAADLPASAAEVLRQKATLSDIQLEQLAQNTVEI